MLSCSCLSQLISYLSVDDHDSAMSLLVATHAKHKLMARCSQHERYLRMPLPFLAKTRVLRKKRLSGLSAPAPVQLINQRLTIRGYDKGLRNAQPLPDICQPDMLAPVHNKSLLSSRPIPTYPPNPRLNAHNLRTKPQPTDITGHSKLLTCTERSHDTTRNLYQCPGTQASTRIARDIGGMGEGERKGVETKTCQK
jgi:hypothetical protein